MDVKFAQPEGFSPGAYQVEITLSADEAKLFNGPAVPFDIPRLAHWLIVIDPGFSIAARAPVAKRGRFANGLWKGRVYTNGVEEKENPTPVAEVQAALEAAAGEAIATARAWADHAAGK